MQILILLLCILYSKNSIATPFIKTDFDYYPVKIHSLSKLEESLNEATPIKVNDLKFHGYTNWRIAWNYKWEKHQGKCKVASVTTNVNIDYTLPKLVNTIPDDELKHAWKTYYDALVIHEEGHAKLAVNGANSIEKELLKFSRFTNCKKLSILLDKRAESILQIIENKNKRYDLRTKHGETQGASPFLYLK
jgi:predicted secreted Zn-dependent protease